MKNIIVAIVDDHLLFADSLALMLSSDNGITVGFKASSGKDFFKKLKMAETKPDVVLMDIEMPEMNGIKATEKLKKNYPNIKVIVVTMHYDEAYIISMLEHGANGYLFKNTDSAELIKAIYAVSKNELYYNKKTLLSINSSISHNDCYKSLRKKVDITTRELEILKLICEAMTAEEIGDELSISSRTVESHRQKLLLKTDSRNIIALVIYAFINNLVPIRQTINI